MNVTVFWGCALNVWRSSKAHFSDDIICINYYTDVCMIVLTLDIQLTELCKFVVFLICGLSIVRSISNWTTDILKYTLKQLG